MLKSISRRPLAKVNRVTATLVLEHLGEHRLANAVQVFEALPCVALLTLTVN